MASTKYASMSRMRGTWSDSPEIADVSAYDDPDEPATIAALIMGSRPRTRATGGAHDAHDEKYGASTLEPEVRELFAGVSTTAITGGHDDAHMTAALAGLDDVITGGRSVSVGGSDDAHVSAMLTAFDDVITGAFGDDRDDVDDDNRDEDDAAREDNADAQSRELGDSGVIGEPVIDESDDEIADDINDAAAAIVGIVGGATDTHRWRDDYANALAISQMQL